MPTSPPDPSDGDASAAQDTSRRAGPDMSPGRASAVIAVATLLTKLTGLARVAVIAARLGATRPTDAFLTAFLVPECIYVFLTEGGLVSALVPAFTRALGEGERSYGRLLGSATALAAALGAALALAAHGVAAPLASVLAMRFDEASLDLTASLLGVTVFYLPCIFAAAVLFAAHNARDEFLIPALGPLAFNLAVIGAAFKATSLDVTPLAWGVVAGGVAQLALQLVPLARRPVPLSLGAHHGLLDAAKKVGPLSLAVAVGQFQIVGERIVASGLPEGTITTLNLVSKLVNLPVGLLGLAVSVPLVPAMSAAWQGGDCGGVERLVSRGHRLLLALVLPTTAAMVASREPLVRMLFGHGAFRAADAHLGATLLVAYGPSLLGTCGVLVWTGAFLATDDALTPAIVRIIWLVINVALNFKLMALADPATIPLAASVTSVGAMVTLVLLCGRRLEALPRGALIGETAILGVAAAVVAKGEGVAIATAFGPAAVALYGGVTLALWPPVLMLAPKVARAAVDTWREGACR